MFVEYVIKSDKTIIERHVDKDTHFGPSTLSGFTNTYKKIIDTDEFLSSYNVEEDIIDTYCIQKNEKEERIKVYVPTDYFNVAENLKLPDCDPYLSSSYFIGPKNIVDFYFTVKNEDEYKIWLENHNYEFLGLPENTHSYVFGIKYDLNTQKLVTHKRYAASEPIDIQNHIFQLIKSKEFVYSNGVPVN